MENKSTIQFIGHIGLHGNSYLQFKINDEYYVYKFYAASVARKIAWQAKKFSAWKALNRAKEKSVSWFKIPDKTQWYGWWRPNLEEINKVTKPVQNEMKSILST